MDGDCKKYECTLPSLDKNIAVLKEPGCNDSLACRDGLFQFSICTQKGRGAAFFSY